MDRESGVPDLDASNLFATFGSRASAEAAVQALRSGGVDDKRISLTHKAENPYVDEAEMRDELEGFGTRRMRTADRSDQKMGIGPLKTPGHPEAQMVVGVHTDLQEELQRAETILLELKPLRLDRFDSGGGLLSTERTGLDSVPVQPGSGRHKDVD